MQQARRQMAPDREPAEEPGGVPSRLAWTPASAERFWRTAYRYDLAAARRPRRTARHIAAMLAQRLPPGAAVATLGDRDAEYAAALLLAGFRVARFDAGPLLRGSVEGLAAHPGWHGTAEVGDGDADLVLMPEVVVQALPEEMAPLFAAARSALRPGGRLAVTVPNDEILDHGLIICPATGTLFHRDQHVRAFSPAGLRALLRREGFRLAALIEAQPDEAGFQSLQLDDWWALATAERLRFGTGEMLLALAARDGDGRADDADMAARWLSGRRALAATPEPTVADWAWDPPNVARFWNWLAASPVNALSFGLMSGPAMMAALEPFLEPGGRHLDIGAGEGEMARVMAAAGYPVAAFEPSPGRRRLLADKLGGSPGYLGAFEAIDDALAGSFDVVMAMEVVEHVLEPDLPGFFAMLDRALARDGRLLISTPNDEDLADLASVSPVAGVRFHIWQHVRSFDPASLSALLAEHGFEVEVVHRVDASALATGASPYARLVLGAREPAVLGNASTMIAIAHRRGDRPAPPRDPLAIDARIVAPAGRSAVAAVGAALSRGGPLRRALRPLVRRLLPLARTLRPHVKRVLTPRLRQALARRTHGRSGARAASLEAAFAARPTALKDLPPLLDPAAFEGGPIVLANIALAAGGAERQLVTTLKGLAARVDRPLYLLCLRLGEAPEYDFFRPALGEFGGTVRNTIESGAARRVLARLDAGEVARMRAAIGWLPTQVQDEIERLTADFIELRPSVVHAWQDSTSVSAAYAARIAGVPRVIVSGRNMAPVHFDYTRPYMIHAYREIAETAGIVMINNSAAGAADYAQWLGVPAERIGVLRNGIDPDGFARPTAAVRDKLRAELGIPTKAEIVGGIFRFEPEKRPLLWIDAAAAVAAARTDCHFIILGDGALRREALDRGRRCGLGDRLHAPGVRPDAAEVLSLFDVLLLTSRFEGTPNVAIEASLAGVPVVATESGGTAEAIDDGVTGHIIRDEDAASIAARIEQVLDDRGWRERARRAGPEFVRQRFGLDRMLRETIELYGG